MSFVAVAVAGSAATGLIGAKVASGAAKDAAKTQTDATTYAAELQKAASDAALAEQKRQFNIGQANLQPWLQSGASALQALNYGLGLSQAQSGATGTSNALDPLNPLRAEDPQKATDLQRTLDALPQKIADAEARLAALRSNTAQPAPSAPTPEEAERIAMERQRLLESAPPDMLAMQQYSPGINTLQATTDTASEIKVLENQLADYKRQQANIPNEIAAAFGMTQDQYQAATATPTDGSTPEGTYAGTGMAHGELMQNFDPSTVKLDDGFEFRLNKGLQALERAGAAKGSGIGGGALKAITEYAQDFSSGEYDKAYARTFNTFEANQANRYNKLAALAGVGQTTANQMNAAGQSYANNVGNITQNNASALGDLAAQGANARASGYVASGNAWGSALGGISGNIMDLILLKNAGLLGGKAPTSGGVI